MACTQILAQCIRRRVGRATRVSSWLVRASGARIYGTKMTCSNPGRAGDGLGTQENTNVSRSKRREEIKSVRWSVIRHE